MNERDIFIEALQKSSDAEREQYLNEACGGDAGLRQRVAGLMRDAQKIGDFLESPAAQDSAPFAPTLLPGPSEKIGDKIGPYKLLQVIGQGGMGVVYMAEQHEPVSRRVALKIIKPGMDTQEVIARFEAERQALAMMDHPSIAKVLDAGATAGGLPFFAMELVKGVPITEYCDKQHLTPDQRLELFLPVCQAIQHAHQKGIIHRDLKPSNVLVALYDGRPVPKVIDFGVAKATNQRLTEKTMFTEFGQVVGTLEYMSPEQAELSQLDIDTRSDIYSLGVMLYELLTGTTPFEKKRLKTAAFVEVLRMIREEEPPRPSTRLSTTDQLPSIAASRGLTPQKLSGLVRGELDWIVMKTLEKDRSRRYETANGLARDIERYLANETVQACPPSAGYRLRKFARRHKGGFVTAALVMIALLVGTAVSTWQAIRATNALESERRTRAALDQERSQLNGKIGDTLLEIAALREKARVAGPIEGKHWSDLREAARRAETLVGSELTDPALVERVRDLIDQIAQDEKNRRMMVRLRELRHDNLAIPPGTAIPRNVGSELASAFAEYGLPVTDIPAAEAAGRVRESGLRDDLLAGLDAWSVWDAQIGGTIWQRLLTIAQAADDDAWRCECRDAMLRGDFAAMVQLARGDDVSRQPAETVLLLAAFLVGRPGPAGRVATDEELSVASTLLEKSVVWHSGDVRFGLALAAWFPGKSRVVDNVAVARETIERLKANGASADVLAAAYFNLSQFFVVKKDSAGVVAACREAVRLMPTRVEYWTRLTSHIRNDDEQIAECSAWIESGFPSSLPYQYRGFIYRNRQQYTESLADFIKWTELSPKDASAWGWRAEAHDLALGYEESLAAYMKAIEVANQAGQNPAHYWIGRASTYRMLTQWDNAIADATRAIELDPTQQMHWVIRGDSYRDKGDLENARADYDAAVKTTPSPGNVNSGFVRRAQLYERLGRWDKVISDLTESEKRDPGYRYPQELLFRVLITCPDRALRDPRRALAIDKAIGPFFAWAPDERGRLLGIAHYELAEWKEAIAELAKVVDRLPTVGLHLAIAHWRLGNHDEARKYYAWTVQWIVKYNQTDDELRRLRAEATELMTTQNKSE